MTWIFLILALLLLAIAFVRYMSSTHDTFKKMNIDSPPTSWFLGNFGGSFKQGIFLSQLQLHKQFKDKKVFGVYHVRTPVLMIKDLDIVKDIMVKYFSSFVNRRVIVEFEDILKDNLLTIKDDHWKHVRATVSPTFSSGRIKRMSPHVERKSKQLVDLLHAKQERNEDIELKDIISHYTLDVIASTGFGLDINTMEDPTNMFAVEAKRLINFSPFLVLCAMISPVLIKLFRKVGFSILSKKSLMFFAKAIDSAMEMRKEEGQAGKMNDFMDLLINAEEESGQPEKRTLTRSEIHGQVLLFIIAGYETVSSALSFTLFLLAKHPECCQTVQKEIDEKIGNDSPNYDNVQRLTYMDMCISESMRMFPPGSIIDRTCSEDVTIQGIHIPKGMVISFPVYAFHHDPEIWPDPEKFQPERFSPENKEHRHPYAYMPFGHGPRACIGLRLALLELKIALAFILREFSPVPCEKTVYPVRLNRVQLKADDGLWVKLKNRK